MKLKGLLALTLAGISLSAVASPAYPGIISVSNPDGSVTEIRLHGDEFFSFVTDSENVNILEKDSRGYWKQAYRNGVALTLDDWSVNLLRSEAESDFSENHSGPVRAPQRMAGLTTEGRSTFPTIGELHFPVVLIEYSDRPFTIDNAQQEFHNMLNQENYSDWSGVGSIRDFYMASSNNKFKPVFDVFGPIKVSHTSSYYVNNNKYSKYQEALAEAMNKLNSEGVDFSIFDNDGDGNIDFVYFFYAGYGQADTGRTDCVWPHQGTYGGTPILMNGKYRFNTYATSAELRGQPPFGQSHPYLDGIGTFCHEFGHVLGLPDLYDAPRQNNPSLPYTTTPGNWTTMDSGCYNRSSTCPPLFSSYEQWVCNWLELEELTMNQENVHCVLQPLKSADRNAYKLRIPRGTSATSSYANEYFLIENRGGGGWDQGLSDSGMLIWHINYNRNTWTSNSVNSGGTPNVEIIPADRTKTTYPGNNGFYTAIYPGCEGELIPRASSPNFTPFFTSIEKNGELVEFDFNAFTEAPDVATVMHDTPSKISGNRPSIVVTWDAYPGASSYMLNMVRIDDSGNEITVGGFDEKNVGNVTKGEARVVPANMDQTFKAYVRVVYGGIPSSKISNVITFVPNQLGEYNSVTTVTSSDMEVRGGNGEIIAPADAQIFNMSGVKVGHNNLPAGIYLVKVDNRVCKVAVR